MNVKGLALLISLFFAVSTAFSQGWETVKSSPVYLWGEGRGTTVAEADKQALHDLISKISLQISGNVLHHESETVTNAGVETSRTFSSVINTYSSATLTNTEKIILENEPDAHVGRWIKRSDIAKIFESRKNKIADYITSARKAEAQGKIDVALKDLYWALSLTKTLQDPNGYSYMDESGESFLAISWIPHYMNEIFNGISIEVVKRIGDNLELRMTYKGRPINTIDYTYFDGRDWSNIYSARDGIGVLELAPGAQNTYYQLKIEYEYRGEAHIDREIECVLNAIAATPMRNAYKTLQARIAAGKSTRQRDKRVGDGAYTATSPAIFQMPAELPDNAEYQQRLNTIVSAIVSKRYDDVDDDLFTEDGKEIYGSLIKYGRARIVGNAECTFYRYGDNIVARGMQMSFSFTTGMRKSFVEEVVFLFDKDGRINNISFGLGKTAEQDILGKGVWSESARFAIMTFLENYQTAYALRRLDYISSIFDDDAVIITGTITHVPRTKVGAKDSHDFEMEHDIIKYNRFTKDSYLRHLQAGFDSKEYINLRFAENDVRKLGKGGELYAIQISQEYYSSNYGDKGYLFLMVDINDPENPIIKVRTWQPEKDPEFGIYGPEHFK